MRSRRSFATTAPSERACAAPTRLSEPLASIFRRMFSSSSHVGVVYALSSRNCNASFWRLGSTLRHTAPFWPTNFSCLYSAPMMRATWPISVAHCPTVRPYNSSRLSYVSPSFHAVAPSSSAITRLMFFTPYVVAFTASASPIASLCSAGSAPCAPASLAKRYHGIVSCILAHLSSCGRSASLDLAVGIGV